ncbi:hypothetical protein KKC08_00145 [Patescibacteria group bacterium]|nr:hypothetical protein [Patescibacteria group bacterium]MCG2701700.1 hypothetical protein [Candidatus Parcubacteria bacterium]MBU4265365.1 hypothetical protein [Patescibacteria group bacterium]MBU4390317.1 hypothetical protein [Patescibacteria group bacterium]MBU4396564.1 hypothetical protein [Patescibacteria group bacterium]
MTFVFFLLFFTSIAIPIKSHAQQCVERIQTYKSPVGNAGGQWIDHHPGWDRYVMYYSMTSTMINGKPSTTIPSNNDINNGGWADRIWYTWHFGDGLNPDLWDPDDLPKLALDVGGPGESKLIADPFLVEWNGIWHMYYEGTDQPDGSGNSIFHATSESLFGPWTKKGEVLDFYGSRDGMGPSWPSAFIKEDNLYLIYTDGTAHLFIAQATDSTGQKFKTLNNNQTILAVSANKGHLVYKDNRFLLFHSRATGVRLSESTNMLSFPAGITLFTFTPNDNDWDKDGIGLPFYLPKEKSDYKKERIYYSGVNRSDGIHMNIGVCTLDSIPLNTPTLQPTNTPPLFPTNTPPSGIPQLPTTHPTNTPVSISPPIPTNTPILIPNCLSCSSLPAKSSGNANCDTKINISDFAIWKTEYLKYRDQPLPANNYNSDFNCDQKVTISDFAIWKTEYLKTRQSNCLVI